KNELEPERGAMERIWAKGEKTPRPLAANTANLFGSFQGMIGSTALPNIKSLELSEGCDGPEESSFI
ncbi:MAG: hypothetical protein ACO1QB_03665, partial [Verrucomicrobiales bacterium]